MQVWAEAEDAIGPMFDRVFAGEPFYMDDFSLALNRNGVLAEAHFSFSYTPVRDQRGTVAGLFGTCIETTASVVNARLLADSEERLQIALSAGNSVGTWDWEVPSDRVFADARFAALYGIWYPHRRDDRSFVTALLTECRAIAEAMAAIRTRVPDAELVQTEDAGFVRSTPAVAAQAAFENHRRWLSLDLLAGRVGEHHPLWTYLCDAGADERELARLRDRPTPPAVVGLNYYVTSDRFLDHRLDRYPSRLWGGNGRQR